MNLFSGLPFLEEFVLDVCKNVKDSPLASEGLSSTCPKLKALKLGHFHGICLAAESQLDGIALCSGLESLTIKRSADSTGMGLIEIASGCCKLVRLKVEGCKKIAVKGMRTKAYFLCKTLVEVKISACKNLDAVASLWAVEPIHDQIERLHIDCVWDGLDENATSCLGMDCPDLNQDLFGGCTLIF